MGELAAFGLLGAEFKFADLHLGGIRSKVLHIEAVARDGGDIVIVQVNYLARVGDDGVRVLQAWSSTQLDSAEAGCQPGLLLPTVGRARHRARAAR